MVIENLKHSKTNTERSLLRLLPQCKDAQKFSDTVKQNLSRIFYCKTPCSLGFQSIGLDAHTARSYRLYAVGLLKLQENTRVFLELC